MNAPKRGPVHARLCPKARHLTDTARQKTSLHHTTNAGYVGEPRTLTVPSSPSPPPTHPTPPSLVGVDMQEGARGGEPRSDLSPQIAQMMCSRGDVGLEDFGPTRHPGGSPSARRPHSAVLGRCLRRSVGGRQTRTESCRPGQLIAADRDRLVPQWRA